MAAKETPIETSPHGPIVAFLNSLNPTLGEAVGKLVYEAGITSPQRLQGLTAQDVSGFAFLVESG